MDREEPAFEKCCGCVPLKLCLHVWAWIKLAADVAASMMMLTGVALHYHPHIDRLAKISFDHIFILIMLMLFIDLFNVLVLIGGVMWKNVSALRMFYYYGLYMIVAEAVIIVTIVAMAAPRGHGLRSCDNMLLTVFVVLGLLWISIDIFVVLAVKSEMIKITNKEKYEFNNLLSAKENGGNCSYRNENIERYNEVEQEDYYFPKLN